MSVLGLGYYSFDKVKIIQSLTKISLKDLYELDYLAWYETTLEQLKQKNLMELDLDSLNKKVFSDKLRRI